jgi:hypothetical protein
LFYRDRWLYGRRIKDIASNLLAKVHPRQIASRTVKEGVTGEWLRDYGMDLGAAAVAEFFHLWHVLAMVQLVPPQEDAIV